MYTVVLVDDEELILKTLSEFFPWEDHGFKVVSSFVRASLALEFIATNTVDLVVTDIKMPMMDGLMFVSEMRRRHLSPEIIIISGFAEFEYARVALREGVGEYLLKPLDYTQLALSLERIKDNLDEKYHVQKDVLMPQGYYQQIVSTTKEYIDKEFAKATLDEAACKVALSPNYLSRIFKNETGQKFSDYLISVKMQNAIRMLHDVNLKIYEIAYACGYDNPKNFTRAFKQFTGRSPWEFREGENSGN